MFIEELSRYHSVAIVGLAKNTGKTECLNYILRHVGGEGRVVALTSIGVDGETRDQVCQTPKPEIEVQEGMLFVTSEKHYRAKRLVAEILDVSTQQTSLGRLVTARAKSTGKVLLSGPAKAESMKRLIGEMRERGVGLTLVDGALSRLSVGSPAVTDALVLATGAAVSCHLPQLVRATRYVYDRICLPRVEERLAERLTDAEGGIWGVDEEGEVHDLGIPSTFLLEQHKERLFRYGRTLFVSGVVSNQLLDFLRQQKQAEEVTVVARDFTKIFASMDTYYAYLKRGGRLKVLRKSRLVAVCINPTAPNGFRMDSDTLREALERSLGIPVYDVKRMEEMENKRLCPCC